MQSANWEIRGKKTLAYNFIRNKVHLYTHHQHNVAGTARIILILLNEYTDTPYSLNLRLYGVSFKKARKFFAM